MSLLLGFMVLIFYVVAFITKKFQPDYKKKPSLRDALVVTALIYLFIVSWVAWAFILVPEHGYIDGVFEVMSGLTTTGLNYV